MGWPASSNKPVSTVLSGWTFPKFKKSSFIFVSNVFNLSIYVKINIISESGVEQSKVFSEGINYNNSENKFNDKSVANALANEEVRKPRQAIKTNSK